MSYTSTVRRGTNDSHKTYAGNWAVDSLYRLVTQQFGGTLATNKLHVEGYAITLGNGAGTADPGTGTVTATLNVGSRNDATSLGIGAIWMNML